jgi:squalene cyclase
MQSKKERRRKKIFDFVEPLLEPQEPLGNGVFLWCEEEGGSFLKCFKRKKGRKQEYLTLQKVGLSRSKLLTSTCK